MHKKYSTIFMNERFKKAVTKKLNGMLEAETLSHPHSNSDSDLIFYNGQTDGLPYVGATLQGANFIELMILEDVFIKVVQAELNRHRYCKKMLRTWKYDHALDMPVLMIRYARDAEEKRLLEIGIKNDSF